MTEHRPILRNKQNTYYPRFSFTPKTGIELPKTGVSFLLCSPSPLIWVDHRTKYWLLIDTTALTRHKHIGRYTSLLSIRSTQIYDWVCSVGVYYLLLPFRRLLPVLWDIYTRSSKNFRIKSIYWLLAYRCLVFFMTKCLVFFKVLSPSLDALLPTFHPVVERALKGVIGNPS